MISRRQARKPYICTYSCGKWIRSGSVYLRHTIKEKVSPGCYRYDVLRECSGCATAHGRAGLLEQK